MGRSNRFSWSYSRSATLASCPRKAFLEYYSQSEPGVDGAAWKLKELVSLPMWAGTSVDYILSRALHRIRNGGGVSNLSQYGTRFYDRGVVRSKEIVQTMRTRARTLEERDVDPFKPLIHHYYLFDVGSEYIESMRLRVADCLNNFEQSTTFRRIQELGPSNWGLIAKIDKDVAPSFNLKGHKIYAAYDMWVRDGDDLHILDWKTASGGQYDRTAAEKQLAVYSLWGLYELKYPIEHIHTQAIWLRGDAEWKPKQTVRGDLKVVRQKILEDIAREMSLLEVRRFASRAEYRANIADFPAQPSCSKCLFCKYRQICPEGQEVCSHVALADDPA